MRELLEIAAEIAGVQIGAGGQRFEIQMLLVMLLDKRQHFFERLIFFGVLLQRGFRVRMILQDGGKKKIGIPDQAQNIHLLRLAEQMKQTEDPLTQLRLRGGTIAVKQDGIVEQIRQGSGQPRAH